MQQCSHQMLHQTLLSSAKGGHLAGGSGHRMLEGYEYERRTPLGEWGTPSLPTDNELSWRWLDSSGYRHPHLIRGLSREACAAQECPPCELEGSLFKAASNGNSALSMASRMIMAGYMDSHGTLRHG